MDRHIVGNGTFLHKAFIAGIVLKGADSVLEIIGGILLLLISPQSLSNAVSLLIRHEISEDPGDLVAGHLARWAQDWSVGSQLFAAFYLFSHGVAKLAVAVALLKSKIWAYHAGIVFFLIFIFYQLYRFSHTRSAWLIVLTVFDIAIIYLTWAEYRRVKRNGILGK
ncbi:MAG: DUF2127 domain-containing protein [Syntrophobacteraceae bacterium]